VISATDPTARLLWGACRPQPDIEACDAAKAEGADLRLAAETAITQRVSGLLWRVTGRWFEEAEWSERLRRDVKANQARELILWPRLASILLQPLAAADLTPLVFKGAALVGRYPSAGTRPLDDIDLVMPKDAHGDLLKVMSEAGWRVRPKHGASYETLVVHPELPGLPVELHSEIAVAGERSCRLTAAELWRHRRLTSVARGPAFGLPPELEIVALATHAAKPFHVFGRLMWSVDVAVVIAAAQREGAGFDWELLERLASDAAAVTQVAVALTHAKYLGVDSPPRLREVAARGSRRAALEPILSEDWPLMPKQGMGRSGIAYALIDDHVLRARYAADEVTSDGLAHMPGRAVGLVRRGLRYWMRLRHKLS
jgi:Uncharacterised nucleotidyltransferase